jgi:asparagine synthase (glutamine-hydrolysing)
VPLGAFLSGGIDSGIVVALMSQFMNERVKTFSIGFEDEAFSELPYARLVADKYNTDHHELIVKPCVPEIINQLIAHHDAPFYDSSAIPTFYVSQFAGQHVTVALSGDGGDEMFAGYDIYRANRLANQYKWIPSFFSRAFIEPLANLVPESSSYINRGRVVREFFRGAALDPLARYTRWTTKVKREIRDKLYYSNELRRELAYPDVDLLAPLYGSQETASELGRLLYIATKTELPADMLRKVDRMSMANSLEVRSPFLDQSLFEFAATLPDQAKLRGGTTKYMLRQLAKQLLPEETLKRPKRGFSVPLDRWLREDLKTFTQDILFDSNTEGRGIFDNILVRQLAAEHFSGKTSRGRELWTLLTIELWQRTYIDDFAYRIESPEPLDLSVRNAATTSREA